MNELFSAVKQVDWDGEAEQEFFGKADRVQNYTDMIEANLGRAAQYANLKGDAARNLDIHVRCDDPSDICKACNKKEGRHVAYNIGNQPHINFCDDYFDMSSLDKAMQKATDNSTTNVDIMSYYNRGTLYT